MKGDMVTVRIEKHTNPSAVGYNWLREESALFTLKYVHGIENPERTEDDTAITFTGVATMDPEYHENRYA